MTPTACFWVAFAAGALPIIGLVIYAEYLLWSIRKKAKGDT